MVSSCTEASRQPYLGRPCSVSAPLTGCTDSDVIGNEDAEEVAGTLDEDAIRPGAYMDHSASRTSCPSAVNPRLKGKAGSNTRTLVDPWEAFEEA
jgi:hypothetical protein